MLWFQTLEKIRLSMGIRIQKKFDTQTIIRKRRNKVRGLDIEEIWGTNEELLKREAIMISSRSCFKVMMFVNLRACALIIYLILVMCCMRIWLAWSLWMRLNNQFLVWALIKLLDLMGFNPFSLGTIRTLLLLIFGRWWPQPSLQDIFHQVWLQLLSFLFLKLISHFP